MPLCSDDFTLLCVLMFSARENLRRCGARTSSRRPETCVELVRRGTSETLLLLLALELLARVGSVERSRCCGASGACAVAWSRAPSGARRLLRRYSYRFTARLEKGRQHFCGLSDMSPRHRGFSRTFPGFPPRTENPRGRHLGARRSQLKSERSCGRKPSYKAAALSLRSAPSATAALEVARSGAGVPRATPRERMQPLQYGHDPNQQQQQQQQQQQHAFNVT